MKNSTRFTHPLALALLVGAAASAGCPKQISILQYPVWYDPDDPSTHVKTVAVLPFRSHASNPQATKAGDAIAENLADLLTQSHTYKDVYNRNNLSALMDQQELKIALGGDPTASARSFRKRSGVQAVITGAVTTYGSTSRRERRAKQVPWFNPRTKRLEMKSQSYVHWHNEGNVSVTATLTLVASGKPIHGTGPIAGHYVSAGESPSHDQHGCLRVATDQAIARLRENFAAVRKTVEVSGDAFRTASGPAYDGQWPYTKKFKTTDTRVYVVLKLPDSCNHNRFRVTIVRDGSQQDLALKNITWERGHGHLGVGLEFDIAALLSAGGGPGKYVAKFYAGAEPVLQAKFEIKP